MGKSDKERSPIHDTEKYAVNTEWRQSISFTVYGQPKQWKRVNYNQKYQIRFNDPEMELYKDNVRAQSIPYKPDMPFIGPIQLECKFYMRIPKSWPKRKKIPAATDLMPHTKTPDLSNLIKNVEDALTGIYWMDDKQIFRYGDSGKFYSEIPRIEITITLIGKEI